MFERFGDGGELRHDVSAIPSLSEHMLHAADLALGAPRPLGQVSDGRFRLFRDFHLGEVSQFPEHPMGYHARRDLLTVGGPTHRRSLG